MTPLALPVVMDGAWTQAGCVTADQTVGMGRMRLTVVGVGYYNDEVMWACKLKKHSHSVSSSKLRVFFKHTSTKGCANPPWIWGIWGRENAPWSGKKCHWYIELMGLPCLRWWWKVMHCILNNWVMSSCKSYKLFKWMHIILFKIICTTDIIFILAFQNPL